MDLMNSKPENDNPSITLTVLDIYDFFNRENACIAEEDVPGLIACLLREKNISVPGWIEKEIIKMEESREF